MARDIREVKNITDLIGYFSTKLGWNIDIDDFEDIEDISYDFDAADIGLKEESFAKISSLRQLQPLVDGQQWGIFCVEFDSNRFEPSALKKILSGLIPRKRNSADHAVWCQQDLLFICNWGTDNNSTIGLAHFEDREGGLPQIKMFSCAPALEDFTQIKLFEERLAQLAWPKNTSNIDEWREVWSSAFTLTYKQTIQDSSTLTVQLAAEAQNIRNRILDILEVETKNGYVHLLYEKFRDTLIHDMSEQQFADMYAQTVVYGLFSARCLDQTQDDFSAAEAIELIPNTNPFLKSLMKECFGAESKSKLSFDELEIGNVVDLLKNTKTDAIIQDFNRQTGGGREDPVIHFYEEFLTAYDKAQKVQRGVYYTPQPVVNFIVRAVDSILKTEFGYEDGLASEETKKLKITRTSQRRVDGVYKDVEDVIDVPAVQILDPATGTGTFLRQTILQIYDNFCERHKGKAKEEVTKLWNEYVDRSLLPRVNGFELMMAPYAVAHMKLAMVLKDTGYNFTGKNRLNVFLTNSLEEAGKSDMQMSLFDDPLATESIEANCVKKNHGINVVIGNPPYAVSSANKGKWIEKLLESYKTEPGGEEKLKEQKHSIDSDETKFIRYAQNIIQASKEGVIAFINPHGYIDKPTFRGMRWQLLNEFDCVYILNLHGNSNHQETTPDGEKDENVFDIQQGVCINIFVKNSKKRKGQLAEVFYADIFGNRTNKYTQLTNGTLDSIKFKKIEPKAPYYLMIPSKESSGDYYNGFCLEKLLTVHLEGIQTGKDKLVLHKKKEDLISTIEDILESDVEALREKYALGKDGRDWTIAWAKEDLQINYPENGEIFQVALRPFDLRWSFYTGKSSGFIKCCRDKVSREMIGHDNYAFALTRNAMPQKPFSNFAIVNTCTVGRFIGDFSTSTQLFPVWSYTNEFGKEKRYMNFNEEIISSFNKSINCVLVDKEEHNDNEYTVDELLGYIYGFLNSWKYRNENKEELCRDFPYVPYPKSYEQFIQISNIGRKLISLHANEKTDSSGIATFCGEGNLEVANIKRKGNDVFINKTEKFTDISDEVWNYWYGGHQIVQKWIKERKGEKLEESDVQHFLNIVEIIYETIDMCGKVDELIGGK